MQGYVSLLTTLLILGGIVWFAKRRGRKAPRHVTGWLEPRVAELEALAVAEEQWRFQVEQRLAALEQGQAPLYRVQ